METLAYLFAINAAITTFNVVISYFIRKSYHHPLVDKHFKFWVSFLIFYLMMAVFYTPHPYYGGLLFSLTFVSHWLLASLHAGSTETFFSFRPFVFIYFGGLSLATIAWSLQAPSWVMLLPICVATSAPVIYQSIHYLATRWKQSDIINRGFAICLLLQGLHNLDYFLLSDVQWFLPAGFSISMALCVGLTLFSYGAMVQGMARDRERLEMSLQFKAQIAHASRLSALGEMAGGIAHEINNPLHAMYLTAGLLRRKFMPAHPDAAGFSEKLDSLNASIDRISRITAGLIAFASYNNDDPKQKVSIEKIINETLLLCRKSLENSGISLVTDLAPGLAVEVRGTELHRALLNLLSNARDAVQHTEEKLIRVTSQEQKASVQIIISNNGPAIPPEAIYKIFEPFYTTKGVDGGTGLGLSITKGIIESYDGTIKHQRSKDQTSFVISLPRLD